jgi:hypothetical protein
MINDRKGTSKLTDLKVDYGLLAGRWGGPQAHQGAQVYHWR